jgi:endonuclease YncB( thermonuclease family)
MIQGQPKAKTFLSMSARSATLFIRASRKWLIPAGESIVSISASVAAQFPSKFLTKAALVAAFGFAGVGFASPCPPPQSLSPPLKIQHVIDGDTVKLNDGSSIRLTGFNSFELKDSDWRLQYARKARSRAQELLTETIFVTPWPASKDRYGRLLGNLWVRESYLAEVLVAEGLALTVSIPPENRLVGCLFDLEWQARDAKRGVWALDRLPEAVEALENGGFQHLVGEITQVLDTKTLVLGERLRVILPKGDSSMRVGIRLEVRGWVSRSTTSIRRQLPWTLTLRDLTNRVRVF